MHKIPSLFKNSLTVAIYQRRQVVVCIYSPERIYNSYLLLSQHNKIKTIIICPHTIKYIITIQNRIRIDAERLIFKYSENQ